MAALRRFILRLRNFLRPAAAEGELSRDDGVTVAQGDAHR